MWHDVGERWEKKMEDYVLYSCLLDWKPDKMSRRSALCLQTSLSKTRSSILILTQVRTDKRSVWWCSSASDRSPAFPTPACNRRARWETAKHVDLWLLLSTDYHALP